MGKRKRESKASAVDALLAFAEKHPGILLGQTYEGYTVPVVSTGNTLLDLLFRGGLPVGRIVELYGNVSQGKTSVAYQMMAGCQAQGGHAIYGNAENAWNPKRAVSMGVDLARAVIIPPCSLEDMYAAARGVIACIRSVDETCPILFVWDTIAASAVDDELAEDDADAEEVENEGEEAGRGRKGPAKKARAIRTFLKELVIDIYRHRAVVVFVNQTIEKIGSGGFRKKFAGPETTTPGGGGIKFGASIRAEVRQRARYMFAQDEGPVGIVSEVKVVKSNLFRPFDAVNLVVLFEGGVNEPLSLFEYLYREKAADGKGGLYVSQAGGWFYILLPGGDQIRCRYRDVPRLVQEHLDLLPLWRDAAARQLHYV